METAYTVDSHFDGKEPTVRQIYDRLIDALVQLGEVRQVSKKGSIHLDHQTGFAGVYTRKSYINLHFRTEFKIEHPCIAKVEQLSARRFKHTVKLEQPEDVNSQLLGWLKDAYELAA